MKNRLQFFVGKSGGADTLLHFGQKFTSGIVIETNSKKNGYECVLVPSETDSLIFSNESGMFYKGDFTEEYKEPYGSGHAETALHKYAEEHKRPVAKYVCEMFESWIVYHFHDTSATSKVKMTGDINDRFYLHSDAGNLTAMLYNFKHSAPETYNKIVKAVRLAAPFFDDFKLDVFNNESIQLIWKHKESDKDFYANSLSDGTLRFICLATLLLQPTLPSVVLLDEPELGLHPYAMDLLGGMLRSASKKTRVIVSTQSVTLVNKFKAEDIVVVERQEGHSVFKRQDPDSLSEWLGEYGMGDLWEKNVLGGRP